MTGQASFAAFLTKLATEHAGYVATLQDAWGQPGTVAEVTSEVFEEFFEMLPPRFVSRSAFGFAEGEGPWTVFWRKGERYFARQLTATETAILEGVLSVPRTS